MFPNAPVFPEAASPIARSVDHLFFFALGGAVFFSVLIAVLIFVFGVRVRRRRVDEVGVDAEHGPLTKYIEIAWSVIPFALLLVLFGRGAKLFFEESRPPSDAVEYWVTAKQWMWKFQHPEGNREINELHVPVNTPIRLKMISEDVIHDLFIPAFRVHVDVLPSRYTTYWFKADRIGSYHLFCSQYCGVEHAQMVGRVVVMDPREYEKWLAGGSAASGPLLSGAELFVAKACNTCHRPDTAARAPILNGIYGKPVKLSTGETVIANDDYIRESILSPAAKIVAGYQPIMPTFKGTITEEELLQLIGYVKSLSPSAGGKGGASTP